MEWTVATSVSDQQGNKMVSRTLAYPMGAWEEAYESKSMLFGDKPDVVKRFTSYLPQPEAQTGVAHVTTTKSALGFEETRRWLEVRYLTRVRARIILWDGSNRHTDQHFLLYLRYLMHLSCLGYDTNESSDTACNRRHRLVSRCACEPCASI